MGKVSSYTDGNGYRCLENLKREMVDLNLCYCGCEDCKPLHRFGPNNRNNYVLHIVWRGKGTFEIGGRGYALERGNAFLIPPEVEAWYQADRNNPWSYFWIGFNGIKAEEYIASAGFGKDTLVRRVEDVDRLYRYVDQMLTCHEVTPANELKRIGLTLLFFAALAEEYSRGNVIKTRNVLAQESLYIDEAVEYIDKNLSKKIKIEELAKRAGISRSYFSICFKKVMGCSPQDYIVNLRMKKSMLLLKTTALSVTEIADSVGYNDPLAFSKIFKQNFGESPKAYRNTKEEVLKCGEKGGFTESDL